MILESRAPSVLEAIELHSRPARNTYPSRHKERDEQYARLTRGSHVIFQKGYNDYRRDRAENVGESLHKEVDPSAEVSGNGTPDDTDDEVHRHNDGGEHE